MDLDLASDTRRRTSGLDQLPAELLLQAFAYLDQESTRNLTRVSRTIRRLATSDALWRKHIRDALAISPPPRSHNVKPLEDSSIPRGPNQGVIGPDSAAYLTPWHATAADVDASASLPAQDMEPRAGAELSNFVGAAGLYEVWHAFVRPLARLLGWYAADVPYYGMLVRIIFDDGKVEDGHGISRDEGLASAPAFVCQRIHAVNRLHGMGRSERWHEVTDFPMPTGAHVTTDGTSLHSNVSVDISVPGIKTEDLWRMTWPDALAAWKANQRAHLRPRRDWSLPDLSAMSFPSSPAARMTNDGDDSASLPGAFPARPPSPRESWTSLPPAHRICHGDGEHAHIVHDASGGITTIASHVLTDGPSSDDGRVAILVEKVKPYEALDALNEAFKRAEADLRRAMPPVTFPSPRVLPAVRELGSRRRTRQAAWSSDVSIDSIRMLPTPLYYPWPNDASKPMRQGPRFVPIMNPPARPSRRPAQRLVDTGGKHTNADGDMDATAPPQVRAMPDRVPRAYLHTPPRPSEDPADARFDWNSIEGLYGATYGPWGVEVVYVRCRTLTEDDFEVDAQGNATGRPHWAAEPSLSNAEMYESAQVSVELVVPGARVVEGVKVTGDPHVPRGQVTFRAFIDDEVRVGTAWRAPSIETPPRPGGGGQVIDQRAKVRDDGLVQSPFRQHAPWPYRAPGATAAQRQPGLPPDQVPDRSPGLAVPGCGRLAGEGFVGAGWVSAVVHFASPDEIRIWWHPMMSVAVAHKLTAC